MNSAPYLLSVFLFFGVVGCGWFSTHRQYEEAAERDPPLPSPPDYKVPSDRENSESGDVLVSDRENGLGVLQIDGVWVFTYSLTPSPNSEVPVLHLDALETGVANIVGKCLQIGDSVVVWDISQLEDARMAVAAAKRQDRKVIKVGGGGFGIDEGTPVESFPKSITTRCKVTGIWYAN